MKKIVSLVLSLLMVVAHNASGNDLEKAIRKSDQRAFERQIGTKKLSPSDLRKCLMLAQSIEEKRIRNKNGDYKNRLKRKAVQSLAFGAVGLFMVFPLLANVGRASHDCCGDAIVGIAVLGGLASSFAIIASPILYLVGDELGSRRRVTKYHNAKAIRQILTKQVAA